MSDTIVTPDSLANGVLVQHREEVSPSSQFMVLVNVFSLMQDSSINGLASLHLFPLHDFVD